MTVIGKKVVLTEEEKQKTVRQAQIEAQMSRKGEYAKGQKFEENPVWVMADDEIISVRSYINAPLEGLAPLKRFSGLMIKENKIAINPDDLKEKLYDNMQAVEDIKAAKEVKIKADQEIAMALRKQEINKRVEQRTQEIAQEMAKERGEYEQKY